MLKNFVLPKLPLLAPIVQQRLKIQVLEALHDSSPDIQNVAGILFGRYTELFPLEIWGDVLPPLFLMLELSHHGQEGVTLGALRAVKRICEDSSEKLLCLYGDVRPLHELIPRLIALFPSGNVHIRLYALESLSALLFLLSVPSMAEGADPSVRSVRNTVALSKEALLLNMNNFLQVWSCRVVWCWCSCGVMMCVSVYLLFCVA